MKPILQLVAIITFALSLSAFGQAKQPDPIEDAMRGAFADYKAGNHAAAAEKLREALKLIEEEGAEKVGELLPEELAGWKGESLKKDDLGIVGGGISISRVYVSGKKSITVKVIKDAPIVKQLLPLIANEELVRLSNRKTYRVSGETAIMDGEKKLQMVVDGRILVELLASGEAGEKELVAMVRKLDLNALEKMK